ncbi:MAG: hypothetical protein ACJ04P_13560 [Halioglobus sp.]
MDARNHDDDRVNLKLLKAAIKFNARILGLTAGTLAAVVMYIATQASVVKWGDDSGGYLGLLAIFFPGYSVSTTGAWIGAFWAFIYFSTGSWLSYRVYGKVLGTRISAALLTPVSIENPILKPSTLRLHGVSLGVAIGSIAALSLFSSTAWLVVRGTADESVHAALFSNYIPGYSVSIMGGLWGAIELFGLVFLSCLLLSAIYNRLVEIRHNTP